MARQKGTPAKPSTNGPTPEGKEPARLPTYFLSLTLENVRCFGPKVTLNLSTKDGKPAPWTIILGLNGTGKTTLLQSLVGLEPVPFIGEHLTSVPRLADPQIQLRMLFPDFQRSETVTSSTLTTIVAVSERLAGEPLQCLTRNFTIFPAANPSAQFGTSGDAAKPLGEPWSCAYGAGRRVGTAALSEGQSDDPTATLYFDKAELRNPEEWLLQLDYAAKSTNQDKETQKRFDQAKELLLAIMPEGEITDIRCIPGSGPNPKARAEFQTPYGWVPLRQLGYGYQTLITWVADLANRMAERYPDSKNPLAEPAVVLVDEIDLHLHPKWQRKLMGFLTDRFPNTQFIATAHSPLVVQAAADANLAVLRREGDHVIIDNEVDNIRNWRIDQILTSDLFGLETARPLHVEAMLLERDTLLEKSKLNAVEKRRLEELNALVDELPFGETAQEREERAAIKKALDALTKERKPAS